MCSCYDILSHIYKIKRVIITSHNYDIQSHYLNFHFFILQFQLFKSDDCHFMSEFWLFNNYDFSQKFDFYVQIVTFYILMT